MKYKLKKVVIFLLALIICFSSSGCSKDKEKIIINTDAYHYSSYACFLNNSFGESQDVKPAGNCWNIQIISNSTIKNVNLLDYNVTGDHELELAVKSFEQNDFIGEQNGHKIYDVLLGATIFSNASIGNERVKVNSLTFEIETNKGKTTLTKQPDILLIVYYVPEKNITFINSSTEVQIGNLENTENYSFNTYMPISLTTSKNIILRSIDFSGENVEIDKKLTDTDYSNLNQMLTTSDVWTSFSGVAKINKNTFDYLGEHIVVSYSLLGETEIITEPVFIATLTLLNSSENFPNLTFNRYIN